jgi:hypothetical protein
MGDKVGDLPVIQPTRSELVVNMLTAKTLGLKISELLLGIADVTRAVRVRQSQGVPASALNDKIGQRRRGHL